MNPVLKQLMDERTELPIAPLIDVVFLLLIYFMVVASLRPQEADLGITLPGTILQSRSVSMPDEQIIDVRKDGAVVLNGRVYGQSNQHDLPGLAATLYRYKQAAESTGSRALITVQASDEARHERVVDVLNVCAGVGIKYVTFGLGE